MIPGRCSIREAQAWAEGDYAFHVSLLVRVPKQDLPEPSSVLRILHQHEVSELEAPGLGPDPMNLAINKLKALRGWREQHVQGFVPGAVSA